MLAWYLCDFSGDRTSISKKPYIFVIFHGKGGGGPDHLSPPLDPAMKSHPLSNVYCAVEWGWQNVDNCIIASLFLLGILFL